ncbi:myrosinase 1-like [Schistocerca americana]|uniref:myrosinase 1-like n=1 Tax=Schistocerca americana TaxID=7009 RepID=UPI001F4FC71B|nr:myrosinase 1-like [Schistocerca americana]
MRAVDDYGEWCPHVYGFCAELTRQQISEEAFAANSLCHHYLVFIENYANVYRFSISWARILPTGDLDVINQPGIDYYSNLINELLANGIQPMVTMYRWDLPQALQYIGGWPNPLLADYFVEYARVLFENFGDRVKWWITFNEPASFTAGYASSGLQAPSQNASGIGDYLATHTVLSAHGLVYHLYDEQYRATQNGVFFTQARFHFY